MPCARCTRGSRPRRRPTEIRALAAAGQTPVWMPAPLALADPDLPRSWDLTSDSLAAWLAGQLGAAALVLVKVAPLRPGPLALDALVRDAIVDPLFPTYARAARGRSISCPPGMRTHSMTSWRVRRGGRWWPWGHNGAANPSRARGRPDVPRYAPGVPRAPPRG